MNIFDALQFIGSLILSSGYIFQIKQIIKTKSVKDLNLKTFVSVFIGVLLMELYAINLVVNGSGVMFLITNSMALLLAGIMVVLIHTFKEKR